MGRQFFKIYDDSKNYTCQVIKLPPKKVVKGLDNLVEVNYLGNSVLISKDYPEDLLYLFFPAESQISHDFLHRNNLYRHPELNADPTQKGYFEDTRRVKAQKFKGIISTGFIIPITALPDHVHMAHAIGTFLMAGEEFNEISEYEVCRKYIRKRNHSGQTGFKNPRAKLLDGIIDEKFAPEHPDTAHLLKNAHRLSLNDYLTISYKLHGTSARTYNTIVKRKLNWKERLAKRFGVKVQEEEYNYVAASRRTLKSVDFEELPGKNHFFTEGDLWSEVAKNELKDKLYKGESVYYEIIGKTYGGEEIQGGYSYGFDVPKIYVYRIANINAQGVEVDLSHEQMEERARQLGLDICPVFFKGTLGEFIEKYDSGQTYVDIVEPLTRIFYNKLLEQPSILDNSVVEEGFCLRLDKYPKAEIYKIKSKKFLEHESKAKDKELVDLEEQEAETQTDDKAGDTEQ
jgi:hypothetical protein